MANQEKIMTPESIAEIYATAYRAALPPAASSNPGEHADDLLAAHAMATAALFAALAANPAT